MPERFFRLAEGADIERAMKRGAIAVVTDVDCQSGLRAGLWTHD